MGNGNRLLLSTLLFLTLITNSGARGASTSTLIQSEATEIVWHDIRTFSLEGKGWAETKAPFDRLPAKAEGVVRDPVWNLSRHAAGMCVRFITDATAIHARWTLTSKDLALPNTPATAVSGLDLYVKMPDGAWRWLAVGRATAFPTNNVQLVTGIPAGRRQFMLYLPLYNGVTSVEVGIPKGRSITKVTPRGEAQSKPIVFYGTSITQGASASRAGMAHTAILGRRLNRPVINLGFSGNGRMEAELATLLAELDAAVYVIDCLPNMDGKEVSERAAPFVRALRKARPQTPILLVEDRSYTDAFLVTARRERNAASRAALRHACEQLRAEGVRNLHYLPGEQLLGQDGEATVDGSHPTDLGFMRQADAFQATLQSILRALRQ